MSSSWRKVGNVVTSCGHPSSHPYPYRLEKVKFGIPLDEVCKNDELLPGPLLVLILKLNKEAPLRKDVFRAPGHQASMKKLIHFLQAGRLVNVDNYSVYTIASVLKKFLRKVPNGIFGRDGEAELFAIVDCADEQEQQERIHRLITSLPVYTQRLLVLLFGTFRIIASNAERCGTGMTSEALGVSVAPSFFQSCVSDGKTARMEDVLRFKVATRIMKKMIDNFATYDLFGRDNYEFYARVTGRILKIQDEWICNFFRFPPPPRGKLAQQKYALQLSLEAEKTWLQCECERWGLIQEESQSTPALLTTSSSSALDNSDISIDIIPELSLLESCQRLSVSLEGPGVFTINTTDGGGTSGSQQQIVAATAEATAAALVAAKTEKRSSLSANAALTLQQGSNGGMKHSSSCSSTRSSKSASAAGSNHHMTMDELRAVNRYAESTKSLSYLPQVHERQTARMRTRSEWFLEPGPRVGSSFGLTDYQFFGGSTNDIQDHHDQLTANTMMIMFQNSPQQHEQQVQQQQLQQQQQQRMDISDEQDTNTAQHQQTTSQQHQTMNYLGTGFSNFPPITVGNIGLSASAESVQYPVKRPSRRQRHHPHRSSSRRNKENGKNSNINNQTGSSSVSGGDKDKQASEAAGTVGVSGGGVSRSNSFRQKKSPTTILITESKLLRKPRAVSFESSSQVLPKVCLTPATKRNSSSNSGSIDEDCETIILMDTTDTNSNNNQILPTSEEAILPSTSESSSPLPSLQLHFRPPRV